MSWIKTGTISVTNASAIVIGSGTSWVSDAQDGYGIIMPNGFLYEILSVDSATQITLAKNYEGTTLGGQPYAIVPTQGLTASLVASVNSLITSYQSIYDGIGQGKFPAGTLAALGIRFADDEDTGFYRPAANQIGAVTGGVRRWLLGNSGFILDVPMTGTAVQASAEDVTPGRLMRADYGYGPGNLVGTVSQAAGAPTGAVIERGSNANGDYVRFADGTQICTHSIDLGSVLQAGSGTFAAPYLTATTSWTFPAAFSVAPSVNGLATASTGNAYDRALLLIAQPGSAVSTGNINALRMTESAVDLSPIAKLTATGRWF